MKNLSSPTTGPVTTGTTGTTLTEQILEQETVNTIEEDINQDNLDLEQQTVTSNRAEFREHAISDEIHARYQKSVESGRTALLAAKNAERAVTDKLRSPAGEKALAQKKESKANAGPGSASSSGSGSGEDADSSEAPVRGADKAALRQSPEGRKPLTLDAYLDNDRDERRRELDALNASPREKAQYLANYEQRIDETRQVDALLREPQSPGEHQLGTIAQSLETKLREGQSTPAQLAVHLLAQIGAGNAHQTMRALSARTAQLERSGRSPDTASIERYQAMAAINCLRQAVIQGEQLRKDFALARINLPNLNRESLLQTLIRPDQATVGGLMAALGNPEASTPQQQARCFKALERAVESLDVRSWSVDNMESRQRLLTDLRTQAQAAYPALATPELAEESRLREQMTSLLGRNQQQAGRSPSQPQTGRHDAGR